MSTIRRHSINYFSIQSPLDLLSCKVVNPNFPKSLLSLLLYKYSSSMFLDALCSTLHCSILNFAQSAGAVEYTDCFSTEG